LLSPGDLGGAIPGGRPLSETDFTNGQRKHLSPGLAEKLPTFLFVKLTPLNRKAFSLKYSLDIFKCHQIQRALISPSTMFSQNQFYNQFPVVGTPPLPSSGPNSFYNPPSGLGIVNKTIGPTAADFK